MSEVLAYGMKFCVLPSFYLWSCLWTDKCFQRLRDFGDLDSDDDRLGISSRVDVKNARHLLVVGYFYLVMGRGNTNVIDQIHKEITRFIGQVKSDHIQKDSIFPTSGYMLSTKFDIIAVKQNVDISFMFENSIEKGNSQHLFVIQNPSYGSLWAGIFYEDCAFSENWYKDPQNSAAIDLLTGSCSQACVRSSAEKILQLNNEHMIVDIEVWRDESVYQRSPCMRIGINGRQIASMDNLRDVPSKIAFGLTRKKQTVMLVDHYHGCDDCDDETPFTWWNASMRTFGLIHAASVCDLNWTRLGMTIGDDSFFKEELDW